ncbi:hypothetical protein C8F01DRAFT_1261768 [Mycena amicta]|nr:hypothetical protein C8F01DRAFT_1261768 [Mycena amicta]
MSSADDVSDVLTTPDDVLATLDDAANDLTESLSPLKPANGQSLRKNVDDASNDSGTLPVVSASTEEPPMVSHDVEVGLHDATAAEKHTSSEPQVTESPSPPEQAQLHGPNADNADKSDELFATPTPVAEDSIQPPQPQIFRPWTPSYSVTTQAPGTPHTEEVAEPVVIVSEIEDPAIETRPEADVARPKSPWTPSYSVVVQGSPNIPPIELEREVPTEHTVSEVALVDGACKLNGAN